MKKIIGIILLLSAFLIGAPHHADAQGRHLGWYRHRERVRVIYYRRPVYYRRYYYPETRVYYYHPHRIHIHVPGVGANAGVGVGPIHVGAGIHLHEVMPPPAGPAVDPSGISNESSRIEFMPTPDTTADVIMPQRSIPRVQAQYITLDDRLALSPDTNANNYYVTWQSPRMVTVDGFDVPVTGSIAHFELFRHGRNGVMRLHNHKGEDNTAQYGISPRGGSLPESIDGNAYSITSKER